MMNEMTKMTEENNPLGNALGYVDPKEFVMLNWNDLEETRKAAEKGSPESVLGFNPVTKTPTAFFYEITPEIAQYILDNHNFDNRPKKNQQKNAIVKSIEAVGFLFDGAAITFNNEGNLTEFQHRLLAIIETGITTTTLVVLGVDKDTFTKTAPAAKRTPKDEIQRKHPNARSDEIICVAEIVKRRKTEQKYNIQTAIECWEMWNGAAKKGYNIIELFFDGDGEELGPVKDYNSYKRTFAAWAALHSQFGDATIPADFLDLLRKHILDGETTTLTKDFYEMFRDNSFKMSNAGASSFMFELLCIVSDRMTVLNKRNGKIQLGVTMGDFGHTKMKKQGFYRKFCENPDDIQATQIF